MRDSIINEKKAYLEKAIGILLLLLLWQGLARKVNQKILLAAPSEVLRTLFQLLKDGHTYQTIFCTTSHILSGFGLAFVVGIVLAILSKKFHVLEMLIWPYIQIAKTVPVASFIILCLVWFPVEHLSVIISFLMVLPIVYYAFLSGLRGIPRDLLEVSKVNRFTFKGKLLGIYLPSLEESFQVIFSTGIAMSFTAGIAAEVIGTPANTIGKMLYSAKIYLATPELVAWTGLIVLVSICIEKIISYLVMILYRKLEDWI